MGECKKEVNPVVNPVPCPATECRPPTLCQARACGDVTLSVVAGGFSVAYNGALTGSLVNGVPYRVHFKVKNFAEAVALFEHLYHMAPEIVEEPTQVSTVIGDIISQWTRTDTIVKEPKSYLRSCAQCQGSGVVFSPHGVTVKHRTCGGTGKIRCLWPARRQKEKETNVYSSGYCCRALC